jgi:glycosyltransferase involved in cell wall biosynthesis
MSLPTLLVASLLPEQGYCGVQTHFRAILAFARREGYQAHVVVPYQVNRWIRRLPGLVTRILRRINPEYAVLWNRVFLGRFLRARLRRHLRDLAGKPAVIYAQDPLSASAALALRREGYRFRLVVVLHFNLSEAYESKLNGLTREGGALWCALMHTERAVLPRLDKVIVVSEYMRRIVLTRNPGMAGVDQSVIPNFPEYEIAPRAEAATRADLISIGTLEPRKNQCYLLHVLAEAKRLGHRYRLTLAGDGPCRQEWEDLALRLGIADQVSFLGYLAGASRLLPGHRVYVHAALMENLPITLLEALSCGLPVCASPVGGIPEIFDDGIEGFAWELDNVKSCAQKLIDLLENETTWEAMSRSARQRYLTHFSPDVLGPKWIDAITADARGVSN